MFVQSVIEVKCDTKKKATILNNILSELCWMGQADKQNENTHKEFGKQSWSPSY